MGWSKNETQRVDKPTGMDLEHSGEESSEEVRQTLGPRKQRTDKGREQHLVSSKTWERV